MINSENTGLTQGKEYTIINSNYIGIRNKEKEMRTMQNNRFLHKHKCFCKHVVKHQVLIADGICYALINSF